MMKSFFTEKGKRVITSLYKLQHTTAFACIERCCKPLLILRNRSSTFVWDSETRTKHETWCVHTYSLNPGIIQYVLSYRTRVHTVKVAHTAHSTHNVSVEKEDAVITSFTWHCRSQRLSASVICRLWGVFVTSLNCSWSNLKVQKQSTISSFHQHTGFSGLIVTKHGVNFFPSLLICRLVVTSQRCIQYGAEAVRKNQCWQRPPPRLTH